MTRQISGRLAKGRGWFSPAIPFGQAGKAVKSAVEMVRGCFSGSRLVIRLADWYPAMYIDTAFLAGDLALKCPKS